MMFVYFAFSQLMSDCYDCADHIGRERSNCQGVVMVFGKTYIYLSSEDPQPKDKNY